MKTKYTKFAEFYVATVQARKQWAKIAGQCKILKTIKERNPKEYQRIRGELADLLETIQKLLAHPLLVKELENNDLQELATLQQQLMNYLRI